MRKRLKNDKTERDRVEQGPGSVMERVTRLRAHVGVEVPLEPVMQHGAAATAIAEGHAQLLRCLRTAHARMRLGPTQHSPAFVLSLS